MIQNCSQKLVGHNGKAVLKLQLHNLLKSVMSINFNYWPSKRASVPSMHDLPEIMTFDLTLLILFRAIISITLVNPQPLTWSCATISLH